MLTAAMAIAITLSDLRRGTVLEKILYFIGSEPAVV